MTPQERAAFIKTELRKLDIRQYAIAKSIGVTGAAINRVINGNRGSERIAGAIAEAIGQPLDRLFPEIAHREEIKRALKAVVKPPAVPPVDAAALERLRRDVKKLMIDLSLDGRNRPARALLLEAIGGRIGRKVSRQILSMALSGYRANAYSKTVLEALHAVLTEKISAAA